MGDDSECFGWTQYADEVCDRGELSPQPDVPPATPEDVADQSVVCPEYLGDTLGALIDSYFGHIC